MWNFLGKLRLRPIKVRQFLFRTRWYCKHSNEILLLSLGATRLKHAFLKHCWPCSKNQHALWDSWEVVCRPFFHRFLLNSRRSTLNNFFKKLKQISQLNSKIGRAKVLGKNCNSSLWNVKKKFLRNSRVSLPRLKNLTNLFVGLKIGGKKPVVSRCYIPPRWSTW